jgi:catechol 2,3-dioxygenase-like lactoylglutathione lyase family enzyme
MLKDSHAFSGFAVDDIEKARQFYGVTLGLEVETNEMGMQLKLAGGTTVFVYAKPDHQPAGFTILNFPVDDIDTTADELIAAGVEFERYDDMPAGMEFDDRGVFHSSDPSQGPSIAWFKDPAGNVLSILKD